METPEIQECRVLHIEPGDIVVFETEDVLSRDMAERLRNARAGHEGIPTAVVSRGHLVTARVVADRGCSVHG
jgi:hypothetical protein